MVRDGFVSSAGTVFEIVKTLSHRLEKVGGDDGHLRRILQDQEMADEVVQLLLTKPDVEYFMLKVDYGQTPAAAIEKFAEFSGVSKTLTRGSWEELQGKRKWARPLAGKAEMRVAVVRFSHLLLPGDIGPIMQARGLKPAGLLELVEFASQVLGANFTELVALGSSYLEANRLFAPSILRDRKGLSLSVCSMSTRIAPDLHQFLAIDQRYG